MQGGSFCDATWVGYDDMGAQDHTRELARAVCVLRHGPYSVVAVIRYDNASLAAEVEKPKHVTGRQCTYQQLFGVVARRIASESCLGRTEHRCTLAVSGDLVVPRVGPVVACACSAVARPGCRDPIVVFAVHVETSIPRTVGRRILANLFGGDDSKH